MPKYFYLLPVLLILLTESCNLPLTPSVSPMTPTPAASQTATPTEPAAVPTATIVPLGSPANPVVFALPPNLQPEQIADGKALADGLSRYTGYTIAVTRPNSYADLVADFGKGNAHLAFLPPFAYADAYQKGYVRAILATQRFGTYAYGAQFIANVRNNFVSYYDELSGQNNADAKTALSQFDGYKPCWDDPLSAAGYVIPLAFLNENGIRTKPPAFVEGHSTVVRSIYAQGICDFGATIIDARQSPAVLEDLPDVTRRVQVIWRIEPLIPYEVVVVASSMPDNLRFTLTQTLAQLTQTAEGQTAMQNIYKIEALQPVNDDAYALFRHYVKTSGLDLSTLFK